MLKRTRKKNLPKMGAKKRFYERVPNIAVIDFQRNNGNNIVFYRETYHSNNATVRISCEISLTIAKQKRWLHYDWTNAGYFWQTFFWCASTDAINCVCVCERFRLILNTVSDKCLVATNPLLLLRCAHRCLLFTEIWLEMEKKIRQADRITAYV